MKNHSPASAAVLTVDHVTEPFYAYSVTEKIKSTTGVILHTWGVFPKARLYTVARKSM